MEKKNFKEVFIGIDPGPKPGVAILADRILVEAFELSDVLSVGNIVFEIMNDYNSSFISVRLGNGDKPNRERIKKQLVSLDVPVDIVDENGTSMPHRTHDNVISAARIANIENFNKSRALKIRKSKRRTQIEKEFVTIKAYL